MGLSESGKSKVFGRGLSAFLSVAHSEIIWGLGRYPRLPISLVFHTSIVLNFFRLRYTSLLPFSAYEDHKLLPTHDDARLFFLLYNIREKSVCVRASPISEIDASAMGVAPFRYLGSRKEEEEEDRSHRHEGSITDHARYMFFFLLHISFASVSNYVSFLAGENFLGMREEQKFSLIDWTIRRKELFFLEEYLPTYIQ